MPADRRGESPAPASGRRKPPLLARRSIRTLCVLCLALVVYGTLGPVRGSNGPWFAPIAQWSWVPPTAPVDFNDIVTNAFVYVPVGVTLRLLVRRRGTRPEWQRVGVEVPLALALAVGLSYTTELLQQMQPGRSSNLIDVLVNGCGALAGSVIAVRAQRGLRAAHARVFGAIYTPGGLWQALALATVFLIVLFMVTPGDLRRPVFAAAPHPRLGAADAQRVLAFAAAGFFLTGAFALRGARSVRAAVKAVLLAGALASILELLQAGISGHVASSLHALLSLVGAGTGAAAGVLFVGARRNPRLIGSLVISSLAIVTTLLAVAPFWRGGLHGGSSPSGPDFEWAPFRLQFAQPFVRMAVTLVESAAGFGLLTLAGLFLTAGHGRAATLLLVLGVAGVTEVGRALLRGQGDITGLLVATVAWALGVHVWGVLYAPREAPGSRRCVAAAADGT